MRNAIFGAVIALTFISIQYTFAQKPKTLVAVWAHADDEVPVGPVLARYAREGAQVYMMIATDGSQGGANTSVPRGPELARVRAEEARCATEALGIHPPILLGFPDGQLGNYIDDPSRLYRLTQRVQEELQRLNPDVVITWGPDGGFGHADHRMVSNIVTQLVRAGAPGLPERLFYAFIPAEGFQAVYPTRGAPPFVIPQAKYLSTRVQFSQTDLETARRSMACHKTQYSDDVLQRASEAMKGAWKGELTLAPFSSMASANDLFR
jgi:LmbE family N-acetylglucosaminyl deacetylase